MLAQHSWKPSSWKKYPVNQHPVYLDNIIADLVIHKISNYKELVVLSDILKLNSLLYKTANRQAIILQAGDCAEDLTDCPKQKVSGFNKLLKQIQQLMVKLTNKELIKIGRIAGQFTKPRTNSYEVVNNTILPVYRGDMINSYNAEYHARIPDPKLILQAYQHSLSTLEQINKINFSHLTAEKTDFNSIYTSHEALLLPYEQALVRQDKNSGSWYSGSAHSLWVGKRTINYKHAHVEFVRGIVNPIGVKICHEMSADELIKLLDIINPNNLQGRVMLIIRMGKHINKQLPKLVKKVKSAKKLVLWLSDPMHGNTYYSKTGHKTRNLTDICQEILNFVNIITKYDEYPAGLHLELTSSLVTECIDCNINSKDLILNYKTLCDPRLNPQQALKVVSFFSNCILKKI